MTREEKLQIGDTIVVYNDPNVEEGKRTGIWFFPPCPPRDIGRTGTVVGFCSSISHGEQVEVKMHDNGCVHLYNNDGKWIKKLK